MKRGKTSKQRAVRVVWDEQNLGFWEAHKTATLKIDEPKTPYHPPEAEDNVVPPSPQQNAAHADAIRLALSQVASTSERRLADGEGSNASSSSVDDIQHPKCALGNHPMFEDDENDQKDKGQSSGSGASSSNSGPEDPESNISKGLGDIDIQDG
ncbi:hypothetical protein R1sor_010961 [Riccia sorocarpa]|uniref:Uncharacterized protein n=1 Tax=Riccia sorocarpa TaxID=122646 RepID=A0ABD3HZI4_9MARC